MTRRIDWGRPQPLAKDLMLYLLGALPPIAKIGIMNERKVAGTNKMSAHAEGRAIDIYLDAWNPHQRLVAERLAAILVTRAKDQGIDNIIWNRRIWSVKHPSWRPYEGEKKHPHTDHIHVELTRAGSQTQVIDPLLNDIAALRNDLEVLGVVARPDDLIDLVPTHPGEPTIPLGDDLNDVVPLNHPPVSDVRQRPAAREAAAAPQSGQHPEIFASLLVPAVMTNANADFASALNPAAQVLESTAAPGVSGARDDRFNPGSKVFDFVGTPNEDRAGAPPAATFRIFDFVPPASATSLENAFDPGTRIFDVVGPPGADQDGNAVDLTPPILEFVPSGTEPFGDDALDPGTQIFDFVSSPDDDNPDELDAAPNSVDFGQPESSDPLDHAFDPASNIQLDVSVDAGQVGIAIDPEVPAFDSIAGPDPATDFDAAFDPGAVSDSTGVAAMTPEDAFDPSAQTVAMDQGVPEAYDSSAADTGAASVDVSGDGDAG